ncbi:MAG: hypothetical protein ACE5GN_00640, partial [Waddliaceae bacterium]
GYTIEEHTLRVLRGFEKDFNTEQINRLLRTGLSREQFALFLALHDIGKGKAVEEIGGASPLRKDKELQYCTAVIQKIAKEIGLDEKTLRIFEALLVDDNIGGLLKHAIITKGLALKTTEELKSAADACDLPLKEFVFLKTLFHKVDASSYPTLRQLFKWDDSSRLVGYADHLQKKMDILEKTLRTFPETVEGVSTPLSGISSVPLNEKLRSLTLEQLLREDPYSFTIDDVVQLDAIRKDLKQSKSELYRAFSNRVKWIKECKLPFRIAAMIKAFDRSSGRFGGSLSSTGAILGRTNGMLTEKCSLEKQEPPKDKKRKIERHLIRQAQAVEDKLKVLEKLTFLHGTNSATLAMMRCSDAWTLNCSGNLLKAKKAPMCGELDRGGFGMNGVNNHKLSAETIRNIGRTMHYAEDFTLPIEDIVRTFEHPYDALFQPSEISLEYTLEKIYTWRKTDEEDFVEKLGSKFDYLIKRIDAAQNREEQKASPNHEIIGLYHKLSRLFYPHFDPQRLGNDFGVKTTPYWESEREKWLHPLDSHLNQSNLGVTGIRLLQLRQWDEDLFQQLIDTKYLRERAQAVEEKLISPMRLLLKTFDDDLSQEEIDFLKGPGRDNPPETLRRFFPTDNILFWINTNFGYDAVRRELDYYIMGNYHWNDLIAAVLKCRAGSSNNEKYQDELPAIRSLIPPQMEKIRQWYRKFYDILDLEKTPITIPKDAETRLLFTKPFPVVFASTTYRPTPSTGQVDSEFHLCESVGLGKDGVDVIITDTEESRNKIGELLPEKLRGEIEIYLYDEIDPKDIPLIHAPHQIRI